MKTLKELSMEKNPRVYFSNAILAKMQGLNVEDALYLIEKGANLFSNLEHTEKSMEILNKDERLNEIIAKWGE
jgi:hypothetical protein